MFGWFAKKSRTEKKYDDGLMRHLNKGLMDNALNDFSQCRRFLDSGHAHEAEGNLDEALICYETSLRLRDTPMGRYDKAGVLILMGKKLEALDELHRAQSMRCTEDLAEMIEQRIRSLD